MRLISDSAAPSNTGVAIGTPSVRLLRQAQQFLVVELLQVDALAVQLAVVVVDLVEELAQLGDLACCASSMRWIFWPRPFAAQPRCDFEDLADVHSRRHAQRVQHDVDGLAVGHVRHVLDRHDGRDDTLVAVAAGHLVARLDAALHGQVHLDHLQHARGEVVALR